MTIKYDITGKTFGRLTAIRYEKKSGYKWLCKCSCGNTVLAAGASLRQGRTKSCGCLQDENRRKPSNKFVDVTGKRFHRLVAQKYDNGLWRCVCDCGNIVYANITHLRKKAVVSCGCFNREIAAETGRQNFTTHGLSKTLEYKVWAQMRKRCEAPYHISYHNYGGRGIKVCDRWQSFENFISDMGKRPSSKHQLDRIDPDGDYTPDNCRWVTRRTQSRNKRNTRLFTFNGKTQILSDWADELGFNYSTLSMRIYKYGWSVERAFTEPVHRIHS